MLEFEGLAGLNEACESAILAGYDNLSRLNL